MRIALAGLAALAVAMGIGRFAFTPLLPMMQADSGLSLTAGGWLASANYLGYFLGALSAGFFVRSPLLIRTGLLAIAATTLAMGFTHQLVVWAALRLAAGIASAWVLVHVSAWCLPRLPGRRTLAGALYGVFGFGYIIPATFIPAMARDEIADPAVFGWAWPVFGAAAVASTLAVAVLSRHYTYRRLWAVSQLVMALGVGAPLAIPGIAGILVAALCVGGSFMVVTMASMQEALQVAGAQAARLMAAMTAAFATGQILGPVFASLLAEARGGLSGALLAGCLLLATSAFALLPKRRNA